MSVLGAFFGVQSDKTRERDFHHAQWWWLYVLVGIVITVIFVTVLVIISRSLS